MHGAMLGVAIAFRLFRTAMSAYVQAAALRNPGNDDALLRWNTCARTIDRLGLHEDAEGTYEPHFGE